MSFFPLILLFSASPEKPSAEAIAFFEKKVRPVLVKACNNCHSADTNSRGGLRVDDRNGLITGGNSGPAIVPGHPEKSLLITALSHGDEKLKMPPKQKLSDEQISDLTKWVKDGAAWPEVRVAVPSKPDARYEKTRKEHWAWQPLSRPTVPTVKDTHWADSDVDRFVLAKLESKGLKPVADAPREILLRRVTFDLTGLPPTPEQIRAFLADDRSDAWQRLIDSLLASSAYGERWGRHWLDVARYGESTGSSRNLPYPHAWRYRDYVINAFNTDKKYDTFIREQVSGDLLPGATDEQRIATGFLAVGVKDVNQRFRVRFIMDNVDEQIDTVSRAFLGLTASCARCHDHKFDPISQKEYYALAGIFRSSDLLAGLRNKMGGGGLDYYDASMLVTIGNANAEPTPELKAKIADLKKQVAEAKAKFEAIRGTPEGLARGPNGQPKQQPLRQRWMRLQGQLAALNDPAARGLAALGVRDSKQIADTELRVRGEAEALGPVVPRGYLSVPVVPDAPAVNRSQSGRLELAAWLTSEKNPLTSRVMVNRVWHHLFGAGLVQSVDNFGTMGDTPSHPELLDHLAGRFIAGEWSVKNLIREIVLSRAYRLGADAPRENTEADPANRLIWRHSPRRLSAEELRDAMLASSESLDRTRPNGSLAQTLPVIEVRDNGPEARRFGEYARASRNRSVYLPLLRQWTPAVLEVFDPAEQGMPTGKRDTTTVAPQALYLLNDPFVWKQSLTLADRLLASDLDEVGRVDAAYRLTVGRTPTTRERDRVLAYVADYEREYPHTKLVVNPQRPTPVAPGERGESTPRSTAVPANPDLIDQTDEPVADEVIRPASPKAAAWGSFIQALLGSAEFRYVK